MSPTPSSRIAFVDESLRQSPHGLYVVAVVMLADDMDRVRDAARSVIKPRQPRFHWRAESEAVRRRMLKRAVEIAGPMRAYACQTVEVPKQERARARCLQRLLWDLRDLGVDELVIESRDERNDRKDRRVILAAQKAKTAPADLAYRFSRPQAEPGLWLADALAGAVASSLADGAGYLDLLGDAVEVVHLTP